jgi:hypothetical protein
MWGEVYEPLVDDQWPHNPHCVENSHERPFSIILKANTYGMIPQFSKKKLNFFFSFLSCSVALGFGVSVGNPQGNSRSFNIFSAGVGSSDRRASSGH